MEDDLKIQELFPDLEIIKKEGRHIFVKDKYGVCKVELWGLLKGYKPTISTAVDPTEYYKNKLKEISPELEVLSEYKGSFEKVRVKTKYGICEAIACKLLQGANPGVKSSVDRFSYYIEMMKDKHDNKYDYSLSPRLPDPINSNVDKFIIMCPEHGQFDMTVTRHLRGKGCRQCMYQEKRDKLDILSYNTSGVVKQYCVDYKGGKCIKCGYDKCLAAFDFHHRDPKDKSFEIGKRVFATKTELRKELDKCDLLCANCHREVHHELRIGM